MSKSGDGDQWGGSYKRALTYDGPPGARPLLLAADGARDRLFLARYAPDGTPRAVTVAAENAGTNVVTMEQVWPRPPMPSR